MSCVSLDELPPELLEQIFAYFAADLPQLRSIAYTCRQFRAVVSQLCVHVRVPLDEQLLGWLCELDLSLATLSNREIAAYVQDQIAPLNLGRLRAAKLVSFDYQSRRCEVNPGYVRLLEHLASTCSHSLTRLHLNVDLAPGRKIFRFADLITAFPNIERLSIHFSAHIELNQRILNSSSAQQLVDILLADLGHLRQLHIFTFPPVTIRLASSTLEEFGLFSSDLTQIVGLNLPALRRLLLQADFKTLVVSNVCETSWSERRRYLHANLFSVLHAGCPRLESVNKYRFPPQVDGAGHRLSLADWNSLIRRTLLRKSRTC